MTAFGLPVLGPELRLLAGLSLSSLADARMSTLDPQLTVADGGFQTGHTEETWHLLSEN